MARQFTVSFAEGLPVGIRGSSELDYILVTIHRSNLKAKTLINIIAALDTFNNDVVFVCHPRTKDRVREPGPWSVPGIRFYEAFSFGEILSAIRGSLFVFTDSGGLIREASHLGKRCLVRRNAGGWPELISAGFNIRVGRTLEEIRSGLEKLALEPQLQLGPTNVLYRNNGELFTLDILCTLSGC